MNAGSAAPHQTLTRWTWVALLVALVGISFLIDAPVERWIAAHRNAEWQSAAKAVSRYLAWPWLMGAALTGLAVARVRSSRDWMRVLVAMMIASSIAGLSADTLRGLTGRTRPNANVEPGWYGVRKNSRWLVVDHAYNSFPSGHVSAAMAFGILLFLWRRPLGVFAFLAVIAVAGARLYLGAHHLSDLAAGAILGGAVGFPVWRRVSECERERIAQPSRVSHSPSVSAVESRK